MTVSILFLLRRRSLASYKTGYEFMGRVPASKQKAARRKKWQSMIEDLAGGDVRWSKQCFLGGSVMTEEGLSFVCVCFREIEAQRVRRSGNSVDDYIYTTTGMILSLCLRLLD